MSEAGVCSRREADRLIENGKVTVDGKRAEMGMRVSPSQRVCVGKKEVRQKMRWCCLRSTSRLESSAQKKKEKQYYSVLISDKVTYIGRLDKDSEGLLLYDK